MLFMVIVEVPWVVELSKLADLSSGHGLIVVGHFMAVLGETMLPTVSAEVSWDAGLLKPVAVSPGNHLEVLKSFEFV